MEITDERGEKGNRSRQPLLFCAGMSASSYYRTYTLNWDPPPEFLPVVFYENGANVYV